MVIFVVVGLIGLSVSLILTLITVLKFVNG